MPAFFYLNMADLRFYFEKAVNTYEKAGRIQKKVAQELLRRLNRGYYQTVVEIGSGRGFLSKPLIETLSFERFIHIDLSFQFLKRLKSDLRGRFFFINARAESIPLRQEIAELIISSSTLHWVKEHDRSFKEIFKILKEGGRFYLSIFTAKTLRELKHASELSGFGSVYPLKEAGFYIEMLKNMKITFNYEIKNYREVYSSLEELLLAHRYTGTNYTEEKKFSGKESFRKFCEIYSSLFSNNKGIYATYEVLFIEGQKLSPFPQY